MIRKILIIFQWFLIVFVAVIAGSLALSRLDTPFQYKVYSVLSGSMEPNIPVGSLVIVVPQASYLQQDVITYRAERSGTETVTHRIIAVSVDEGLGLTSYRTQGDANDTPDRELIPANRVVGKVLLHVPWLGYPVNFAQSQMGFLALIVVPATIIIYSELMTIKSEVQRLFANWKAKDKKKQIVQDDGESGSMVMKDVDA